MRRICFLSVLFIMATGSGLMACASAEPACALSDGCGANGGAGGTSGTSTSGSGGSGAGGTCETAVPETIPLSVLSETPPVTAPDWTGDLTWEEPAPSPAGGYEVEVYVDGCTSELLPGYPVAVPSGNTHPWTPPSSGRFAWRVRALGGPGCPSGEWSGLRSIFVPAADLPVCSDTKPDPLFGTSGGQATFYLPGCTYDSVGTSVNLDPTSTTGEFFTAGRYYNGSVRRGFVMKHESSGALVSSWGNNGVVDLGTPSDANYVHSVHIGCDGKIHIGSKTLDHRMHLLRLTQDGAVDVSFGGGTGEVWDTELIAASITDSALTDLDPKGRYLVSATRWEGPTGVAVVTRYTPSGDLDPAFGTAGRAEVDFDPNTQDAAGPVKIQRDGRVILAGYTAAAYPSINTTPDSNLVITRLTVDGELDPTFGDGGFTTIDIGGAAELPTNLDFQPDGKILVTAVANHTSVNTTPASWLVARLTLDGALDPTFGDGGIALLDPPFGGPNAVNDRPRNILVRPDGTIWVAGQWGWNSGVGRAVLARLTADGKLDTCFGTGGWYSVPSWPQGFSQSDVFNDMAQEADGSLLLIAGINPSATGYVGVMRLKD